MPKNLEQIESALKEAGLDLMGDIKHHIEYERTTGQTRSKAAENKTKEVLSELGYTDGDVNSFVANLKNAVKIGTESKEKLTAGEQKLLEMQQQIESITSTLNTEREEKKRIKQESEKTAIQKALTDQLGGKIYSHQARIDSLMYNNRVKVGEDGNITFDGQDFEVGVKTYLEKNKNELITQQSGGAGGLPKEGNGGQSTIKRSQFNNMSHDERRSFAGSGGDIIDD